MKHSFSTIMSLRGGHRLSICLIGRFGSDTETKDSKAQNLFFSTCLLFYLSFNYQREKRKNKTSIFSKASFIYII